MRRRLLLESLLEPERDERPKRQPSWDDTHLFWLPKAGELNRDRDLRRVRAMIAELKRHPQVITGLLDRIGDLRDALPQADRPDRHHDREQQRDLPDRLRRANERRARRRQRSARRRGRPRLEGNYALAYLAMIRLGFTEVSKFAIDLDWPELWEECGFARQPEYPTVWLYFAALEKKSDAFKEVAEWLVSRASRLDQRIGQFVWIDATKWQTNARLEHCCPNHAACETLSKENWERHKIRPPAKKPKRMPEEELQRFHQIESHVEVDEDDEVLPEELRFEQMEFDPETDFGRREEEPTEIVPRYGEDTEYQYFQIHGHLYRTRDKTCGMRKIIRRSGRVEYWLGGYAIVAVDMYTKTIIAIHCFPADEQEYDHYPELMRAVRRALGRYPRAVCADAFYSITAFFRWNTMRGIATVTPFKAGRDRTRPDYRTDLYDEHGVPRCQHCGGEGVQDGLTFDKPNRRDVEEGETPLLGARLHFHCKTPQPGEPGCLRSQSVLCREHWRLLVPLSRTSELYYALRKRAFYLEGTFRHWRQLYGGQGKETMSRLARRGVGAQELRAQAALMTHWFRISLRNGWLARPDGTLWRNLNENTPVQLSGPRRLPNGRIGGGVGRLALNRVLASRRARGLDLPYGAVAIRKGYARPPAAVPATAQGGGGPPPLPPGDDGRPSPELPIL